eukprot:359726-Chlamydomonas_euryale.AAC.5
MPTPCSMILKHCPPPCPRGATLRCPPQLQHTQTPPLHPPCPRSASINASIGRGSLSHDGSTLSGPVSRAGALRTPDESAPPLAPLHSKALPPLPPTVADGPGSLGCGGGPRTLRSASSMPSGRRGAATGRYSSARYGYLADPPPRADTATEAAMAAMAARVQRRRDAEERATLGALNSQRRGAVL